jgi:hypothetical protein
MHKTLVKIVITISSWFVASSDCHSQGYIVPNGVVYAGLNIFGGYEVRVIRNPTNAISTGFWLEPVGKTPPTSTFTNTFAYENYLDVGVRVFLLASNQPVSLQPILANTYTEFVFPNNYIFANASPFYVGLYTGNDSSAPPDGIYKDPLFGWAQLVNDRGVIRMLDSALSYKTQGIYAGTQNFVPEPSALGIALLGSAIAFYRRRHWRFTVANYPRETPAPDAPGAARLFPNDRRR